MGGTGAGQTWCSVCIVSKQLLRGRVAAAAKLILVDTAVAGSCPLHTATLSHLVGEVGPERLRVQLCPRPWHSSSRISLKPKCWDWVPEVLCACG